MIRNIFIVSLFLMQFGNVLSFEKPNLSIEIDKEENIKGIVEYVWQEVGQIKCDNCSYVSFAKDDQLLVKTDIANLMHINILSYDKDEFNYAFSILTPRKLVGLVGLSLIPPQHCSISFSALYKAEIVLENKKDVSGNFIKIYKKVPKSKIKRSYWQIISDHPFASAFCAVGILGFTLWQLKKKFHKLNF